jgi:hypothetical protein
MLVPKPDKNVNLSKLVDSLGTAMLYQFINDASSNRQYCRIYANGNNGNDEDVLDA